MMRIERTELARSTLEEFADKNDLVMEISERTPNHWPASRYYARFRHAEIVDGQRLISSFGNGASEEEAIEAYMREISGRRLKVYDQANNWASRYIDVPLLTAV
ncbi:MAG: hypothetical protein IPH13_20265 [Planctomycetes bacterium]|nr:hypothetical protein [Planctomycetota bacterium]